MAVPGPPLQAAHRDTGNTPCAKSRLAALAIYALAMACVESALVVYLRDLYYPANPRAIFPLALLDHRHLAIELLREFATLVMIGAVAWFAARDGVRRFAAFVYVFGLWDMFYYAWLKAFIDWPATWQEWDVLFLIPWPWLGPWLAPVVIALVFVPWGGWALGAARPPRFARREIALMGAGVGAMLAAFLAPAAPLVVRGPEAMTGYVPGAFAWALFVPGWAAMTLALGLARNRP
jgi:hypothetical protein